jgi:aminoglycoside phosphotransferase family enzyme
MWTQATSQLNRHKAIELETKVARLMQSRTHLENPCEVTAIETCMSRVFLTDMHVYKFKKPVRYRSEQREPMKIPSLSST